MKSTEKHDHSAHASTTTTEDHANHISSEDKSTKSSHTSHNQTSHNQTSHDHSNHDPKRFRNLFWVSLFLTVPTVFYAEAIQELLNYTAPVFPLSQYLPAILGTLLFFIGGRIFIKNAGVELSNRKPGMMSLISLALIVSFSYSLLVTSFQLLGISWMGMDFWWELATLISIMLLGHWIEMSAVSKASGALNELAKMIPDSAERITGKKTEIVSVSMLAVGDLVLVRPGATIPADGQIVKGASAIDESMLTGESKPVSKKKGDSVVAGSINGSSQELGKGALTIEVAKIGENTVLAGVVRLVSEAQKSKTKTQLLADRAASILFYLAIASAIATGLVWGVLGTQSPDFILEKVVTVLIIACPHALGLAIPLVSAITASNAAKQGVLIRDKRSFELARKIGIVLFDKTGTLTTAKRSVISFHLAKKSSFKKPEEVLSLAASLERKSEHSLAYAITEKANELELKLNRVSNIEFSPGVGVLGNLRERDVRVGSAALLTSQGIQIDVSDLVQVDAANKAGNSVVYVVLENALEGYIIVGDEIRPSSKQAVRSLLEMGKPVAIVSGDALGVVEAVSREVGVKEFYGELLPEAKIALVKKLQAEGLVVGFVGDGVNDAPALSQADVGLAIGAGTDVAIESAGVILVSSDPEAVSGVIELSKKSHAKMIQNLWWAAGYNLLAIPAAAGVFYSWGFELSPAVGAVLMSLSTVIVAANAQLLRRR